MIRRLSPSINMKHYFLNLAKILALGTTLGLGVGILSAFGPSGTPAANNAPAPINISATAQAKSGHLSVGTNVLPSGSEVLHVTGTLATDVLSVEGVTKLAFDANNNGNKQVQVGLSNANADMTVWGDIFVNTLQSTPTAYLCATSNGTLTTCVIPTPPTPPAPTVTLTSALDSGDPYTATSPKSITAPTGTTVVTSINSTDNANPDRRIWVTLATTNVTSCTYTSSPALASWNSQSSGIVNNTASFVLGHWETTTLTTTCQNSATGQSATASVSFVIHGKVLYNYVGGSGPYTFTVPADVTSLTWDAWSAGGGGGGGQNGYRPIGGPYYRGQGGGAGAGGKYTQTTISATPGQAYTVTVGAGGLWGPEAPNGGSGSGSNGGLGGEPGSQGGSTTLSGPGLNVTLSGGLPGAGGGPVNDISATPVNGWGGYNNLLACNDGYGAHSYQDNLANYPNVPSPQYETFGQGASYDDGGPGLVNDASHGQIVHVQPGNQNSVVGGSCVTQPGIGLGGSGGQGGGNTANHWNTAVSGTSGQPGQAQVAW